MVGLFISQYLPCRSNRKKSNYVIHIIVYIYSEYVAMVKI